MGCMACMGWMGLDGVGWIPRTAHTTRRASFGYHLTSVSRRPDYNLATGRVRRDPQTDPTTAG